MPVSARIKILECKNLEEVENKVNDFLAFDENIYQLVNIDYRLEFNIVIIEYNVLDDETNNRIRMMVKEELYNGGDSPLSSSLYVHDTPITDNPFLVWWRLCFPFSGHRV